jgi:hypothetical protein
MIVCPPPPLSLNAGRDECLPPLWFDPKKSMIELIINIFL